MANDSLQVSRSFDLPIERVFDAWLDPLRAGKWLFASPTGNMVRVEIDAKVGGAFLFTDRRDGEDIDHVGKYLEVDRPRRLVFSFGVPRFSASMVRVEINLVPATTGCDLTLTQFDTPAEWVERTREGWRNILEKLTENLAQEGL